MQHPAGRVLVGVVGMAIVACGITLVVEGARKKFVRPAGERSEPGLIEPVGRPQELVRDTEATGRSEEKALSLNGRWF